MSYITEDVSNKWDAYTSVYCGITVTTLIEFSFELPTSHALALGSWYCRSYTEFVPYDNKLSLPVDIKPYRSRYIVINLLQFPIRLYGQPLGNNHKRHCLSFLKTHTYTCNHIQLMLWLHIISEKFGEMFQGLERESKSNIIL